MEPQLPMPLKRGCRPLSSPSRLPCLLQDSLRYATVTELQRASEERAVSRPPPTHRTPLLPPYPPHTQDERQEATIVELQRVYEELQARAEAACPRSPSGLTLLDAAPKQQQQQQEGGRGRSWWSGLFGAGAGGEAAAGPGVPPEIRGLYMYGGVGVGKTFLMDLLAHNPPRVEVSCGIGCVGWVGRMMRWWVDRPSAAGHAEGRQGHVPDPSASTHRWLPVWACGAGCHQEQPCAQPCTQPDRVCIWFSPHNT